MAARVGDGSAEGMVGVEGTVEAGVVSMLSWHASTTVIMEVSLSWSCSWGSGASTGLLSSLCGGVSSPLLVVVDEEADLHMHGRSNLVSTNTSPLAPLKMIPQQISVLQHTSLNQFGDNNKYRVVDCSYHHPSMSSVKLIPLFIYMITHAWIYITLGVWNGLTITKEISDIYDNLVDR